MQKIIGMPTIKTINGLKIIILARSKTGTHGNRYVKISKKKKVVGKYLIDKNKWEDKSDLNVNDKKLIEEWIANNKKYVEQEIKKLENI